jgi:hypothetical protein
MEKEFENLLSAIDKWQKINKGQVSFIGSFVSFDVKKIEKEEDDCVKDDLIVAYGDKKSVKIAVNELKRMVDEDKTDFINW